MDHSQTLQCDFLSNNMSANASFQLHETNLESFSIVV